MTRAGGRGLEIRSCESPVTAARPPGEAACGEVGLRRSNQCPGAAVTFPPFWESGCAARLASVSAVWPFPPRALVWCWSRISASCPGKWESQGPWDTSLCSRMPRPPSFLLCSLPRVLGLRSDLVSISFYMPDWKTNKQTTKLQTNKNPKTQNTPPPPIKNATTTTKTPNKTKPKQIPVYPVAVLDLAEPMLALV